jgi:toxin ParE1/3/4
VRFVSTSAQADDDLIDIIALSQRDFGVAAAMRYGRLIKGAYLALAENPARVGVTRGSDAVHLFHLRHLKSPSGVKHPRHLVAFQYDARPLHVLRLFHDAMDLPARLADL